MAGIRSDAPLAKQIVRSFLQFLRSVETGPEVDPEAVIVASQCLEDAFGLDVSRSSQAESELPDLIKLFRQCGYHGCTKDLPEIPDPDPVPQTTVPSEEGIAGCSKNPKHSMNEATTIGDAEEKIFEQFREGLDGAGYFDGLSADTLEYREHLERSRSLFAETLKKLRKPGTTEQYVLAECFKAQGNTSMSNSRFIEAIDLYTMAISLCGDNAVYYSNRAAAHTQIGKYEAAIADSNKAIQLDPNYSKAYSRLGLAYYTQGNYQEAIERGFQKAYLLDPNSKSIQENLMVAQRKLDEERARCRQSNFQPSEQQPQGQTNNQGTEARFSTTIPLNMQQFPQQAMAGLFPAVANLAAQFSGEHASAGGDAGMHGLNVDGQPPDIRMDGNMNVTVEGDPQFAGLMQSMLQMFGGAVNQTTSGHSNDNPSQGNQESGR